MARMVAQEPSASLLAVAGLEDAERRAGGCAQPVRLRGQKRLVNTSTGEVTTLHDSAGELDGVTYVRCRDRRVSRCPSCSAEYKGDAWHLIMCGLAGGKGIPASVAEHPCTFATLTAPSFGPVHGLRAKGPCRARRDRPLCTHGRPLWCAKRHQPEDPELGQPLCMDCYDYTAHVLWQWHAPELWRRFTIALQRELARKVGMSVARFRKACRISYSKVVEFQARGVIHVHVPIRLDGPDGPDGAGPGPELTTTDLEEAIVRAAAHVTVDTPPVDGGAGYRLRWGSQVDTRPITDTAHRNSGRGAVLLHPERVAAYLAKYLTKTTEDFGLTGRVRSVIQARAVGASPHAVRIIATAVRLAGQHQSLARLRDNLTTLGYRGHPITKSRAYSVTFGQLRRLRRLHRRRPAALAPDADVRQLLDVDEAPEGFEIVSSFVYVGRGYLDLASAAAAVTAASLARAR